MKGICAATALLLAATGARAAPIPDVAPWVARFQAAALANDPEALMGRVREVIHPRFPVDALAGIVGKIGAVVGTQPGDHAEQFDEANVGTFYKRVNVAIHYPSRYLFYSLTFLRDEAGWQLVKVDYNTDINEVFKLTWPN